MTFKTNLVFGDIEFIHQKEKPVSITSIPVFFRFDI